MIFFKISPTLSYQLFGNEMVLGKGSKQKIINDLELIDQILSFIKKIDKNLISKKEVNDCLKDYSKLNWSFIKNNDFLIDAYFDVNSSDSRNEMFWNYKFNDINFIKNHSDIVFVIWGCGGIGSSLSFYLSSMGFKNFILIDKDKIEKTNLNRQFLFSKKDISLKKTFVLKRELEKRFDNLSILNFEAKENFLQDLSSKLVNSRSLIILSADEDDCVQKSTQISISTKAPLLNVGYLNDISVVGPFCLPNEPDSSCLLCNSKMTTDQGFGKFDFLLDKAPSWMGNNSQAILMAIREIILYLKNKGNKNYLNSFNKRFGLDFLTLKRYSLPMPKNNNCPNHLHF